MAKKQSTDRTSTLAALILSGAKIPTIQDAFTLSASVLGQDETKGKRRK